LNKVFDICAWQEDLPEQAVKLALPATSYELLDILKQLGADSPNDLYCEVEQYHRGKCLESVLEDGVTLPELNALTRKVAELDSTEEVILEGLVKMECQQQGKRKIPYLKLLQLTENTDCCHWVSDIENDEQLGKFYAENGFSSELEGLPDEVFRLLDFAKIGREWRQAEGGVFTQAGYFVRHQELREPKIDDQPSQRLDQEQAPGFQIGEMGGMG